jgi:hypothetical protein
MIETGRYVSPPDARVWVRPHSHGKWWLVSYSNKVLRQFRTKQAAEAYRQWAIAWFAGHYRLVNEGWKTTDGAKYWSHPVRSTRRGR